MVENTLWNFAPTFGLGDMTQEAQFLTYSHSQCFWSTEPPLILKDGSIGFPKMTYRQEWTHNDGSPMVSAPMNEYRIIKRDK